MYPPIRPTHESADKSYFPRLFELTGHSGIMPDDVLLAERPDFHDAEGLD